MSGGRSLVFGIAFAAAVASLTACNNTDDGGITGTSTDTALEDPVALGTVSIGTMAGDLPAPAAAPDAQMQQVLNQIAAANARPMHMLTPNQPRNQPTFADGVRAVLAGDDGALLERALRAAGVPVEGRVYDGVTREFFGMAAVVREAAEAQ